MRISTIACADPCRGPARTPCYRPRSSLCSAAEWGTTAACSGRGGARRGAAWMLGGKSAILRSQALPGGRASGLQRLALQPPKGDADAFADHRRCPGPRGLPRRHAGRRPGAHRHPQEDQGHRLDHTRTPRVVDPVQLFRRQAAGGRLFAGLGDEGRRCAQETAQHAQPAGEAESGDLADPHSRWCKTARWTSSAAPRPTIPNARSRSPSPIPSSSSARGFSRRRRRASRIFPTSPARRSSPRPAPRPSASSAR